MCSVSKNAFEVTVSEHFIRIEFVADFDEAIKRLVDSPQLLGRHAVLLGPVRSCTSTQHQFVHSFEHLVELTVLAVWTAQRPTQY